MRLLLVPGGCYDQGRMPFAAFANAYDKRSAIHAQPDTDFMVVGLVNDIPYPRKNRLVGQYRRKPVVLLDKVLVEFCAGCFAAYISELLEMYAPFAGAFFCVL